MDMNSFNLKTLFILICLSLQACGLGADSNDSVDTDNSADIFAQELDVQLYKIVADHELTGDPANDRNLPTIDSPRAKLGKKLFFAKSLSGNMDVSCATCHHPLLGGGDALSLSVGVDAELPDLLGPGRQHLVDAPGFDGGPTVPRNSPSTFNSGLWDSVLFWDGRIESLGKTHLAGGDDGMGISTPDSKHGTTDVNAVGSLLSAQAAFPVTSKEEMLGFSQKDELNNKEIRKKLAYRLSGIGEESIELPGSHWLYHFQLAFNSVQSEEELITFANIKLAIAEYEKSQVFTNTPWKHYVEGDVNAISVEAKQGAILFFDSVKDGGANCASCHRGDFFTDEGFHSIGAVQIGRGKGNGAEGDSDFGRANITGNKDDKFAFRTPTLMNVEVTGPWGHSGAFTSIESVIKCHLDPFGELDNFDFNTLDSSIQQKNSIPNTQEALDYMSSQRERGKSVIQPVALNEEQVGQLVEFLKTLTDPCVKDSECLSPWIPDYSDEDPDGTRLFALGYLTIQE